LIREFIASPVLLAPLQTREVVIERGDMEGGAGANFLVTWFGAGEISTPILEAISVSYALYTSFASQGKAI